MMGIAGLQKNSLIDYPGKLSSVIFYAGCNFDCPYCHNPDLAGGGSPYPADLSFTEIYEFLEQRRGLLDGVVISGGEPTLQNDLVDLCTTIKKLGYPVKLDTNGSRPGVLAHLIAEGLVDYVAMDLKTDPLLYTSFIKKDCSPVAILSSVQIIMDSEVDYEFRTTCVKPIVTPRAIENISRLIQGSRLYALQRFHNRQVLHPEFFRENNYEFTADELLQLKVLVEPWVDRCIIR